MPAHQPHLLQSASRAGGWGPYRRLYAARPTLGARHINDLPFVTLL